MGQILGVGTGVFIILFFGVLFGALCIAASRTKYSRSTTLTCATLYSVLLLFLLLTPRTAEVAQDEEMVYNSTGVLRRVLIVLLALTGSGGISAVASDRLFTVNIARSITYGRDVTRVG